MHFTPAGVVGHENGDGTMWQFLNASCSQSI